MVAHIALGVGVVGVAAWAIVATARSGTRRGRLVAPLTGISDFATTATGTIFLGTGFAEGVLVHRILAPFDLAGSALMIVWGSPASGAASPRSTTRPGA
ncbi:MAG TPA: hypothetical protein VFF67_00630 [Thermoplasmata archaeon]|nr:hypothetical protein [Thermoplasmata archaeon]